MEQVLRHGQDTAVINKDRLRTDEGARSFYIDKTNKC